MIGAASADEPKGKKVEPKPADADAPPAEGFPDATKPGTIEVKHYPAYRSAMAKRAKATADSDGLMFFTLFNHIRNNHVEMTAPVINTYKTPAVIETPGARGEVSMEFVYRSPTEGKTGPGALGVTVVDHPAADFVCLGLQGEMTDALMRDGLKKVRAWLDEHKDEWVADGPPRRLGYHGPMTPAEERLWEIQVPVKLAPRQEEKKKEASKPD
jgi:hypothetical protein